LLFRHYLGREAASDSLRRLLLVIVINAGFSFMPGISWEGHFGGGVVGFVTAGLLNALRFGDRPRRRAALVLLAGLPVLCVGTLLLAMDHGRAWADFRQRLTDEAARQAAEEARQALGQRLQQLRRASAGLEQLSPERVGPVEKQANALLLRPGPRRNAE